MSKKPREMLSEAAVRALKAMAALANTEIKVDFTRAIATGPTGVDKLDPWGTRIDIRLLEQSERWLGLAVPKTFLTAVGAGIMMMPTVPEQVTEEISLAFDEAVNVGIGAWNAGLEDPGYQLDNGVDARRSHIVAETHGPDDPQWAQVWRLPVRFQSKEYWIALTGDGWLPLELPVAPVVPAPIATHAQARPEHPADAGPQTRFATAARLDEPSEPPARRAAPPLDADYGQVYGGPVEALVMVVDETGALRRWLAEQLRNPAYAFSSQESEGPRMARTVILVDERGLESVSLRAHKKIVMRLA